MTEYRVRWRREGRAGTSQIYQTEAGARDKIDRLLALDEIKPDTRYEDMPDLTAPPILQQREVGDWQPAPDPQTTPTAAKLDSLRDWAAPIDHDPVF